MLTRAVSAVRKLFPPAGKAQTRRFHAARVDHTTANWLTLASSEDLASLGAERVVTVGQPEDARYFDVQDVLVGAVRTIVSTPKDPEVVAALKLSEVNARIDLLERETLLPRATREFMLLFMESSFPAESLAVNPGYQRVKAFDLKIKAVREGTWVDPEVQP